VKFWIDLWSGDLPLHLAYLVLYNLATNRAAFINTLLIRLGVGVGEVGMFVLFGFLMIGRWRWWMISFVSWLPIYLQWMRVIV